MREALRSIWASYFLVTMIGVSFILVLIAIPRTLACFGCGSLYYPPTPGEQQAIAERLFQLVTMGVIFSLAVIVFGALIVTVGRLTGLSGPQTELELDEE